MEILCVLPGQGATNGYCLPENTWVEAVTGLAVLIDLCSSLALLFGLVQPFSNASLCAEGP